MNLQILNYAKMKDNKSVVVASNFVGIGCENKCRRYDKKEHKYIEVPQPQCIAMYNNGMGGVDKLNGLISLYRIFIRWKKWTLRMFTHALDIAITNSWLEYKRHANILGVVNNKILDLIHFRQYITDCLVTQNSAKRKVGRPSNEHENPGPQKRRSFVERAPNDCIRLDRTDHMPIFDSAKKSSQCKNVHCKNKKTHFMCQKCNVHLCITRERNCFLEFHSM